MSDDSKFFPEQFSPEKVSRGQFSQGDLPSLIQVTRDLTALIKKEISLLNAHRPGDIARLAEDKNRLAATYHQQMTALQQAGGLKTAGSADHLRLLKKVTREFQEVLEDHKRKLKALKTISEKMIKAVGDEIARQANKSQAYGANAKLKDPQMAKTPTTLTLNETI